MQSEWPWLLMETLATAGFEPMTFFAGKKNYVPLIQQKKKIQNKYSNLAIHNKKEFSDIDRL